MQRESGIDMKNYILYIGIGLILLGLFKPNITNYLPVINPNNQNASCLDNYVITPPDDINILEKCNLIIDILQSSNANNKKYDALKLSSLYADIATLIRLDGDDLVVKDTQTIREVNSLTGQMLKLDIKGKYPNLASSAQDVIKAAIGDDDVLLSTENREKAAQAFDGLSWAFYEGGK
jgi:hypothetical protein